MLKSRINQILAAGPMIASSFGAAGQSAYSSNSVALDPEFGRAVQRIIMNVAHKRPPVPELYERAINRAAQIQGRTTPRQQVVIPNEAGANVLVVDPHTQSLTILPIVTDKSPLTLSGEKPFVYVAASGVTPDHIIKDAQDALERYNNSTLSTKGPGR